MSKAHSNSRVQQEYVKSDTDIQLSYEVLKEFKRGLKLNVKMIGPHNYLQLVYTTLDGKQHIISEVDV